MAKSKIEWTGRSDWNPVRGCTRKSHECVNCYAEVMAARFSQPAKDGKPAGWGHGFAHMVGGDHRWTGKVEVQWDRLLLPLSWREPAIIFGSSTSDIFHEALPDDDIAQIIGVAVAGHHLRGHTTQFLTKRSDKMRQLLNDEAFWDAVNVYAGALVMERVDPLDRHSDDARATLDHYWPEEPAPGVWFGVSAGDQDAWDERVGDLRRIAAAVRFVSAEPLLGPIDDGDGYMQGIDWLIAGGESGQGARPMHPDWVRSLRDQCADAGVPLFFKQWGEWAPGECASGPVTRTEQTAELNEDGSWFYSSLTPRMSEELHCDDAPDLYRFGKRAAGRMLDGVTHDGFPA